MPLLTIWFIKRTLTSLSNPLSGKSARKSKLTSIPKLFNIEANSVAIYPDPSTPTLPGVLSSSNISSDVSAFSSPFIWFWFCTPPTAITRFFVK